MSAAISRRLRTGQSAIYPADVWETDTAPAVMLRSATRVAQRNSTREMTSRSTSAKSSGNVTKVSNNIISKERRLIDRKMGGLSLPDVVRELLKEEDVLRWDSQEGVYEVVHGDNFEARFNELRKVRNKTKPAGVERPFSRMYNFFILQSGDKWARTGTKFRPRNSKGMPCLESIAKFAKEGRRVHPAVEPDRTSNSNVNVHEVESSETDDCSAIDDISSVNGIPERTHGETCGGSDETSGTPDDEVVVEDAPAEVDQNGEAEEDEEEEEEKFFVAETDEACASSFPVYSTDSVPSNATSSSTTDISYYPAGFASNSANGHREQTTFYQLHTSSDMDVDNILRHEDSATFDGRRCVSPPACRTFIFRCRDNVVKCEESKDVDEDVDLHSVYDVTSPDASCRSSPEGALSLCGEFGGSPLDIGAPALDTATAAAALLLTESCDGILMAGLDVW